MDSKKTIIFLFIPSLILVCYFLIKSLSYDDFYCTDFGVKYNQHRIKKGLPLIETYFEPYYSGQKYCETQNWRSKYFNRIHQGKDVVVRDGKLVSEKDYYSRNDSTLIITNNGKNIVDGSLIVNNVEIKEIALDSMIRIVEDWMRVRR